ncbi:MAG TPA: hypothetical protein VKU01_35615 [Bryobacteraceae bacterium]|nr:hypothetical protein [Bryobacteraceae bacterium]
MQPARIVLKRTSPEDVRQRQVIVKLDDEHIGNLMFGKTMTRAVDPGHHTLRVDNTWNKRKMEFDIAEGGEAVFRVINRAGRFTWFLVSALGAGPMYVSIEPEKTQIVSLGSRDPALK